MMKADSLTLILLLFYLLLSSPDGCDLQESSGTIVESNARIMFYHNPNSEDDTTEEPRSLPKRRQTTTTFSPRKNTENNADHSSLIPVDNDQFWAPNWSGLNHEQYRPNEYRLIRHLLRYYDRRVRPVQPHNKRVNITFGLAISQIIDVDEKNQLITTNCWLNTAWVDFQLTWNPSEWGGVENIRIPYNIVWLPDILLYNSADMMTYFSSVSTNVIIHHTGNVTWLNMIIYRSTCSIDVRYFPFDVQNCSLLFSSWTYDGTQLAINTVNEEGDVSNYIENTEWHLLKFTRRQEIKIFSCCPDEPYPFITYSLVIRRRPLFYVYNLFVPCILITLVALLGFLVPSDSGEKVSMGITTLLSMTVFLMVVAESMPPTKTHVPLLGLYFGFTILVVSCTTGLTVLTLNIHHKGKRGMRMPKFLRFVVFKILARVLFQTFAEPKNNNNDQNEYKNNNHTTFFTPQKTATLFWSISRWFCKLESSTTTESLSMAEDDERQNDESPVYSPSLRSLAPKCINNDKADGTLMASLARNVNKLVDASEKQQALLFEKQIVENEWQQASVIIDRLSLAIFFTVTVAVTLLIIMYYPTEN